MKNKQPDSVLLTRAEYERLSKCAKTAYNTDLVNFIKRLPPAGPREVYTLTQLKYYLNHGHDKSENVKMNKIS